MTSFTRKLYNRDPAAAQAFARAQQFEHRLVYGKNVTLAQFTPAREGTSQPFGKRTTPPTLPAYFCWAPVFKLPKSVVHAVNSFEARKVYAAHHGVGVTDVVSRRSDLA